VFSFLSLVIDIKDQHIILFDGVCNLCNSAVQRTIKWDKKGIVKFSSLQSDVGQILLKENRLNANDFDSFVFLSNEKVFLKSSAVIQLGLVLKGGWSLLVLFKIIPKWIRDKCYDLIAKNRYKWFGIQDVCMVPTEDLKNRFLN
jgi:predicted DCC family thiol-disulfide oxidoreductase YuxK